MFTPSVCADPWGALAAALPFVDVLQVRVKSAPDAPAEARATFEATERALAVVDAASPGEHGPVLVTVNDRVDVAKALAHRGVVGVHVGEDDCPPEVAREVLGHDALIGLSTHDPRAVARTLDLPVDSLGFGPCFATETKGYPRGKGPEAAWAASQAALVPVFPIGGITAENAFELAPVGRAAVASAILGASDPGEAARAIRAALVAD